ncbi:MAG: hypothetical protein IPM29_02360 [Planctomycetes bacterium]|nr:hypothetical protein [Planctomycetota bacterium]
MSRLMPRLMSRSSSWSSIGAALLAVGLCGAPGPAQKPVEPVAVALPGGGGPQGFEPGRVLFDAPRAGVVWAATGSYKAQFDAVGVTFVPYLGRTASRDWPLRLRIAAVAAGASEVAVAGGTPQVSGDAVEIRRGGLVERWLLRGAEAEQTFVFDALPARGELSIELVVESPLVGVRDGAGLAFEGPDGGVRYGAAVAIDAAGRRTALTTELRGDRIVHRLPAEAVADAALPLVVDPVLYGFGTNAGAWDFAAPDVAYEAGTARYAVVSERWWSVTDRDVWCEYRDEQGALIAGTGLWIDVSTDDWTMPKVAANRAAGRFLTVAQVQPLSTLELRIRGRVRDAGGTGTVYPELALSDTWVQPARRPDVGGDGNPNGTTRWAVVFEYGYSATDTDIYYQMVNGDGTLLGGTRQLTASAADDREPGISKLNGISDAATQRWMVVFARRLSAMQRVVYGCSLMPDGTLALGPYYVGAGLGEVWSPVVSSPTEVINGARHHLVCWQNVFSATDDDILCALVTNGLTESLDNLSVLEGPTHTRIQAQPAVDSDGCRFVVSYSELVSATGNDYDVFVTTVHATYTPVPRIGLSESRIAVATGSQWEGAVAVSARQLGGADARYMVAWEDSNGGSTNSIRGAVYEGAGPGGITRLPHGCHGFPIDAFGRPLIGQRVTVQVPGPTGGIVHSGILFGLLRSPALPIPMCSQPCLLGVDGPSFPATIHIDIPPIGSLVGVQAAVQGWDLLGGSCAGAALRVSDTLVLTVR